MTDPFDIDEVMARVAAAVGPFPKAAMFELAERGHGSAFEQVVACLLSIRTRDEVSLPASLRLFAFAATPEALAEATPEEIASQVQDVAFAPRKAEQIREIARIVRDELGGTLPCDDAVLQSLPGIGPKCAHLVLAVACGEAAISVDVHVDRVTNRWGYVATSTPEKTMEALEKVLPKRYWVEINRLLVPFGKHMCTGTRPKCSSCPVATMCSRVGVTDHR